MTRRETELRHGTLGGMMLTLVAAMGAELLHTALIAATGAIVSFVCSLMCRWLLGRFTKKR